jgi:hypothetical protein
MKNYFESTLKSLKPVNFGCINHVHRHMMHDLNFAPYHCRGLRSLGATEALLKLGF